MSTLEKRITKETKEPLEKVDSRPHSKISINFNINSSSNEIERFAISVLKTLINNNVPPSPENFKIYFEKLLDEKDLDFQKKIQELFDFEESSYGENRVEIEKDIKKIFSGINSIIEVVNSIYKNILLLKKISQEIKQEISHNENSIILESITNNFNAKLNQFTNSISKQMKSLQEKYKKTGETFKNIENSTIFDTRFGVYNKRYFLSQLKLEIEKIRKFHHKSSVIVVQIKDNILQKLPYQKDKIFLLKIIAKMLLKTSRRNDIISYFGENSFIVLLRHTDLESAKGACKRIYNLLTNSNIILNDTEINLEIGISLTNIEENMEIEESISYALEIADNNSKNGNIFDICESRS